LARLQYEAKQRSVSRAGKNLIFGMAPLLAALLAVPAGFEGHAQGVTTLFI
jgi:hypothetical protein